MALTMTRGDARQLTVTLTHDGSDWPVPNDTLLRATAKHADSFATDADDGAVWAKTSEAAGGITYAGNVATITLAAADTNALCADGIEAELQCDVQATGPGFGPWTVAEFVLTVTPDVTRTA